MVDRIIDKNLNFLQKHGVKMDTTDDRAVYKYGLQILYYYLIDLVVIFSFAYVFGRIYETIIMTSLFGVLQVFGGGYHAKTPLGCLATMSIGAVIGNVLIVLIAEYTMINLIIAVVLGSIIIFLPPVMNKRHPVGKKVRRRSKNIVRAFVLLLIIVSGTLSYFDNSSVEIAIIATTMGAYIVSWIWAKMEAIHIEL